MKAITALLIILEILNLDWAAPKSAQDFSFTFFAKLISVWASLKWADSFTFVRSLRDGETYFVGHTPGAHGAPWGGPGPRG